MLLEIIQKELKEHLKFKFSKLDFTKIKVILVKPPNKNLGHLTFGCFSLTKELQLTSVEIASALAQNFATSEGKLIKKFQNIGPYLNIYLNFKIIAAKLFNLVENNPDYGKNRLGEGQKIMVEFSSPNTNKPMHLGHARNNAIGFSILKLLEYSGYETIAANLVNDRGIHICQSMLAYHLFGCGKTPVSENQKGDHFVGGYYVLFHQKAKEDPSLIDKSYEWLKKWEKGDVAILQLWKKMNAWVLDGFKTTYKRTGIAFDKYYFESETYKQGKEEVLKAFKKGICFKNKEQAIVIDLEKEKLGSKVLLRADGTSVYITQDIYTSIKKFKDYRLNKCIFVVGSEQQFHFKTLFTILKKFGYQWAENCQHLSYGMIHLPEGKMKSREGKIIDLDQLLDDTKELSKKELEKRNSQNRTEQKLQEIAEHISQAAIKYCILRTSIAKDFLFDFKQSINFEGNTGPYLQYTYARIKSLLEKADFEDGDLNFTKFNEDENQILLALLHFPEIIKKATQDLDPNLITSYSYNLCRLFNKFYYANPVLKAIDNKIGKLKLVLITSKILERLFYILGIHPIEKM